MTTKQTMQALRQMKVEADSWKTSTDQLLLDVHRTLEANEALMRRPSTVR